MKRIRFITVSKRVFRDLRNDKRTLALIVIAPLFAMFIFGLAFSGEVKNVRVLVVNQDQGTQVVPGGKALSVSDKIISNLDRGVLDVKQSTDENAALKQIKDGNAFAAIIFPADLTRSIISGSQGGENATVKVLLDKSNINVANAITKTINDALLKTMNSVGKKPPVSIDAVAVFGKNAKSVSYFVPGILSLIH